MDALEDLLRAALHEMGRGRHAEAAALLAPHAHVASNPLQRYLGESLRRSGQAQAAIGPLMQALALKIDDIDAYLQLAFALQTLQMKTEAAECFRTVAALRPDSVMAQAYQAHGDQQCARWDDFDANLQALHAALRAKPEAADDEFGVPFALAALPHAPADLLKVARLSTRFLSRGIASLPLARAVDKPRLRIGYLSGDFHAHATAALMVEVLECRDRASFEVLLFSHGPDDGSPLQQRVRAACDRFIDVGALDAAGIAARMRAEGVDIAVDLKGHTAGSRFTALAARPAPVQVAWLGFPGTCGADYIDYVIGDPIVTPLADAPFYSERIAQLPRCYQPGDATRRIVPTPRAALGLPEDAIVLLSANVVHKILPPVFEAWMVLLHRLPSALLWQLSGGEQADARLREQAARHGVAPERIVFMPPADMADHWNRLAAADLALDTWPYNGHTTTSDALAAGVPVVTLRGDGFASRVAESLLAEAGVPELVCETLDDYVERACALATGPRPPIRPWIDSRAFARDLEALYRRMWARAVAGLPPDALPAASVPVAPAGDAADARRP